MGFGPPPPPRPPVNTTGGPKKGPSGREGGGAGASSLGGPEGIQRSLEAAMVSLFFVFVTHTYTHTRTSGMASVSRCSEPTLQSVLLIQWSCRECVCV